MFSRACYPGELLHRSHSSRMGCYLRWPSLESPTPTCMRHLAGQTFGSCNQLLSNRPAGKSYKHDAWLTHVTFVESWITKVTEDT